MFNCQIEVFVVIGEYYKCMVTEINLLNYLFRWLLVRTLRETGTRLI